MLSNAITIFRTLLTLPLFVILAFGESENRLAAVALFLAAGLLDMVDGKVARARNEVSAFGGMMDLVGDRLLTFAAVTGLIAGGGLAPVSVVAGLILIGRDLVVASLNEALPGKLGPRVSAFEKVKIVAAFLALTLLIAGPGLGHFADEAASWGAGALWIAAALTCVTVVQYWLRALAAFRAG
ncbi:CDP-alcohol phosphatidyltransferase family protein [Terricaulis sp.]|uniref:CDP-alcohol phosphatidyltransferase family protein n=1 Tax=Terricaulis sp. TaxID=2768686 RepID=UPI0037832A08